MALRIPRLRINRMWLVLGGAIVMGLLAAWLSVNYLKNREQVIAEKLAEDAKGGPTTQVVVATSDLPKGTLADGAVMAAREVPTDLLYDDVVTADNFGDIEGKTLIRPVLKGRPLRKSDVFDDRPRDLASELTPGNRALTIDIDELNSFSQMLRAGSFVDLYLMAQNPNAAAAGNEIRPLLPRVRVIATGTALQVPHEVEQMQPKGAPNYSNITIDVTPEDAVRVALATQVGRIRAVLRKPDAEDLKMAEMGSSELFDGVIVSKTKGKNRAVSYIVGGSGGGTGAAAPTAVNLSSIPGMPNIPGITSPATGTQPTAQASVPGMTPAINSMIPAVPTGTATR